MRYIIFVLLSCLPFIGGATVAAPIHQGKTAIAKQVIPDGFAPKKQRFFERMAEKILTKRIYKAVKTLGRAKGDDGKELSTLGLICGLLGIPLLVFALQSEAIAMVLLSLLLGLSGLVLCQIGLDRANAMDHPKLGVKAMAYIGLGLNLLLSLVSGGGLFLFLAFGGQG